VGDSGIGKRGVMFPKFAAFLSGSFACPQAKSTTSGTVKMKQANPRVTQPQRFIVLPPVLACMLSKISQPTKLRPDNTHFGRHENHPSLGYSAKISHINIPLAGVVNPVSNSSPSPPTSPAAWNATHRR
jgi:hypothetical protein